MYQKLMILGRLGRDAELSSGPRSSMCRFSVAVDKYKKESDGGYDKGTQWFNCTMFGKRAENLSQYLTKGTVVFVDGEINEFQKQDGSSGWGINVKDIQLASKGGRPERETNSVDDEYSPESKPSATAYSGTAQPVSGDLSEIPF